jgi:hypothetical protein
MLKEFLTNVMRVTVAFAVIGGLVAIFISIVILFILLMCVIGPVLGLIAYVIFAIIVTAATYTWL